MKKILIVNPFGIGDVLFSTPLIAALKAQDPDSVISYIGNARTSAFLQNDTRIAKVYSYERDEFIAAYQSSPLAFIRKWWSFVAELRAPGFDAAFDLSLGSPLALALVLAGIPRRIGFDFKGRGRWLTEKLVLKGYEGRHVADYYLDLVKRADQGPAERAGLHLAVSARDKTLADEFLRTHGWQRGAFILIHPGGGESWGPSAGLKRWPAVNFAKLADKIVEIGGHPIILLGGKNEVALCDEVAGKMKERPLILAGQTGITETAALMRLARLVIANDGGPLHMAVASGVRTVSIFGPVDPVVYGPYPPGGHIVVQKGLACQPCYRHFRMSDCAHQACLRNLSVDEVWESIKGIFIKS